MLDNYTKTIVAEIPECSFCTRLAKYDAKTIRGAWAFMCEQHFADYGYGLGLGKGQELVLHS